jgi:tetratricopeptide (TPR) repeat protein
MAKLGVAYEKGYGVKKNLESALKLYKQSVEAGNEKPLLWIANLYAKQDKHVSALEYYKQAADKGSKTAFGYIGWYYVDGKGGLPKDYEKAMEYFKLADDEDGIRCVKRKMLQEKVEKAKIQQRADDAIRREKEEKAKGKSYIALVFNWLLCGYLLQGIVAWLLYFDRIWEYIQYFPSAPIDVHMAYIGWWLMPLCGIANFFSMWGTAKERCYRKMFTWGFFGKYFLLTIICLIISNAWSLMNVNNEQEDSVIVEEVFEDTVEEKVEEKVEKVEEEAEDYF